MTTTSDKMLCPNGHGEMNHHSDKLVYPTDEPSAARMNENPAGFMEEFHTCPKCGFAASRRASGWSG